MPRAARSKPRTRPEPKRAAPQKKPKTVARKALPAPVASAPPPPPVDRRQALAVAAEAARQRLWGAQGQPLTMVEGVTIASAAINRGRPHWHLLTFGMGLDGLELSLRVVKGKEELAAPSWAVQLLTTLIERAKAGALGADTNQVVQLAQGVAAGTGSDLGAIIFALDPELPALQTGRERIPVLLAVPVTRDEAQAVREWSPNGMIEVLSRLEPLLITDLGRSSLLDSPRARHLIDQRMEKEGSSLSSVTANFSEVGRAGNVVEWRLSADDVPTLISLLKGRTGHLRSFAIIAGSTRVDVVSADPTGTELADQQLTLKVNLLAARQLRAALRAKPGRYVVEALPNFALVVC